MMTSSNGNIFRITGPLCGEFTGPGEFPTQRPVTRSFDVFFDLRLNKRLSKQPWGWWFETLSWSLWRHCNDLLFFHHNSNVMEISYCSHLNFNQPIAPSFFTCHDSCAVMACAKSWNDIITKNWITVKRNFHQIWFVMEQALVKGIPQLMMKCGSLIEWYSCNTIWPRLFMGNCSLPMLRVSAVSWNCDHWPQ